MRPDHRGIRAGKGAVANRTSLLASYSADLGHLVSRRRAEAALRAAAIESAMASRSKSEFLANMSHELRTPLNAIIGFSELIESLAHERRSAGKPREYATHILSAGRHLLEVINDILNISTIESGKMKLQHGLVDVREIIETSVPLSQRRIEQKRQVLEINLADGLPHLVGDHLRLKQVLINLLSNASKFTGEGGLIRIAATRQDGTHIAIAVSDTGCGMTEEEIGRAMQPFMRVQTAYSRREEGTGLGLPIARGLILQHGGTFHIASTPDVGTTVTVILPVDQDESRNSETEAA